MLSIFDEIIKLRGNKFFEIDYDNSNRYRIVLKEQDGSKTAYYFSCPIYNNKTKKLLNLKFDQKNNRIFYIGSNVEISFDEEIILTNEEVKCVIRTDERILWNNDRELRCGNDYIYPTTNGFMYKMRCNCKTDKKLELLIDKKDFDIFSNNKALSIMSKNFTPFVTISCIGCADKNENIIAPSTICFERVADNRLSLSVTESNNNSYWIMFEVNLYEQKAFQDTTVESANPTENNVFGSVGFIGYTEQFGFQWLYTKPNFYLFSDVVENYIIKAKMHLPQLNDNTFALKVFNLVSRFCSFGTTWSNKDDPTVLIADSNCKNGYQSIDITQVVTDKFKKFAPLDGCVIRSNDKKEDFCVIATGDCYYKPQIYEINYI